MDCSHGLRKCFLPELNDSFKLCVLSEMKYSIDFNFSLMELFKILKEYQLHDRNVTRTTGMILITIYAVLIVSGLSANLIISLVVARKAQMHTPRNLYIVNLTVSDMTLCIVCMPFTLMTIIQRHWDLGQTMCKLVPALQGANILVSVGTITVIALDRYFTIVCRQEGHSTRKRVFTSIVVVWFVSLLATSPLFYFQALVPVRFHKLILYEMCLEQWPSQELKVVYTTSLLLVQAVIPVLVVGGVHTRIATHLRSHARSQHDERRVQREIERNRRTTLLLSIVAILFALSWLPLNVFSLMADVLYPAESTGKVSPQNLYVAFAICHVIAMTSAISNPVVYGWLNSNIRHEFLQLLQSKCSASTEEGVGREEGAGKDEGLFREEDVVINTMPPVCHSALTMTSQTVTTSVSTSVSMQTLGILYENGMKTPKLRPKNTTLNTVV